MIDISTLRTGRYRLTIEVDLQGETIDGYLGAYGPQGYIDSVRAGDGVTGDLGAAIVGWERIVEYKPGEYYRDDEGCLYEVLDYPTAEGHGVRFRQLTGIGNDRNPRTYEFDPTNHNRDFHRVEIVPA